ncbi:putative methyltransferase-domain-containing protein [Suillus bovinus]|uniref:putative methyltransferase-domain-containing protein n=1 Tax=Suillus bovinus TaxID=48563 RepID=UPI001B866A34|nr:putative methyltransferase-domain-containing protein [Suillus bovinus]KAG2138681.1 putative methyltransferase-domain-containing protein [Suillus bovinus]
MSMIFTNGVCYGNDNGLLALLKGYSALIPPLHLKFPVQCSFTEVHTFLLHQVLLDQHLEQYPPSGRYQHSFWKWAIEHLERMDKDSDEEDGEIDTRIYDRYLFLMSGSIGPGAPPPDSYMTYYWKPSSSLGSANRNSHETITLLESRTTIESGTTGLRTWYASFVLASYLIVNADIIRDQTVLELGCGSGFLGIIVATIQQKFNERHQSRRQPLPAVLLTDVNAAVLSRCRDNIQLRCNQSSNHPNITFSTLDWFDALSLPGENVMKAFLSKANVGVVIGADVVFDPILVPPLVATLRLALSFESTRMVVVALTVRNEQTLAHFVTEAGEQSSTFVVW